VEEKLGEIAKKCDQSTYRGHGKTLDEGHVIEAGHDEA
jgi:hypothetical protein